MSDPFLVGFAVNISNIVIHALVTMVLVRAVQGAGTNRSLGGPVLLIVVMVATGSILMVAHIAEVFVWSLAYGIVGAAPAGTNLTYFAFVNYTTLGYGDVIHVTHWQLLGPMTAMNGMLMFGWSTAVIFEVLRRAMIRTDLVSAI